MRSWRACMVSRQKARGKRPALVGTGKRWWVTCLRHSSPCRQTLRARALSFWTEHTCLNFGLDDIEGEGEKPVRPARSSERVTLGKQACWVAQRQRSSKLCKGKSSQQWGQRGREVGRRTLTSRLARRQPPLPPDGYLPWSLLSVSAGVQSALVPAWRMRAPSSKRRMARKASAPHGCRRRLMKLRERQVNAGTCVPSC